MTDTSNDLHHERICFNCNSFFPDTVEGETGFGICVADDAFEPFIDELFNNNLACCKQLIKSKRFLSDKEACPDFEQSECYEIDDELGESIIRLSKEGELSEANLQATIWRHQMKNSGIDSPTIQNAIKELQSLSQDEQKSGLETLVAMGANGNQVARDLLIAHFLELPIPAKIEEVHHKDYIFNRLEIACGDNKKQLLEPLLKELAEMPSNNTTRGWINTILKFLARYPDERTHLVFKKILSGKARSAKFKQKIKAIIDDWTLAKRFSN